MPWADLLDAVRRPSPKRRRHASALSVDDVTRLRWMKWVWIADLCGFDHSVSKRLAFTKWAYHEQRINEWIVS